MELRKLKRISPSKFSLLKKCPYRVVLANSSSPLLPYPPASHLGNIIHECVRLVVTHEIRTDAEFSENWNRLLIREEKNLERMGFGFFTPLSENVPGYTIKKMQVKSLLKSRKKTETAQNDHKQSKSILTEKWLESKDSVIGGYADIITNFGEYTKLSDLKTGNIFSPEGEVKGDYKDQLKLYAYLHNEVFGKYPDELSIIDLNKKEYEIAFTPEECEVLATKAREALLEVNNLIERSERKALAKPDSSNCKSCLYRPACEYYWSLSFSDTDSIFRDIKGCLTSFRHFRNGNLNAILIRDGKELIISHLGSEHLPFLTDMIGRDVAFFNVKQDTPDSYQALKTTKIYES